MCTMNEANRTSCYGEILLHGGDLVKQCQHDTWRGEDPAFNGLTWESSVEQQRDSRADSRGAWAQGCIRIGLTAGDTGLEAEPAIGHSAASPLMATGSAKHSAQREGDCYLLWAIDKTAARVYAVINAKISDRFAA